MGSAMTIDNDGNVTFIISKSKKKKISKKNSKKVGTGFATDCDPVNKKMYLMQKDKDSLKKSIKRRNNE